MDLTTTRQRRPLITGSSSSSSSSKPYSKTDKPSRSNGGDAEDRGLGWFLPFIALCYLRYMSATSNIVHDCDEVFNYWEPLHYLLYKSGFQTWEYSSNFALRSYLYILFHELAGRPAAWWFGGDKVRVFYAVRLFLGLVSAVSDTVLVVAISRKYGKRLGTYAVAMLCLTSGCFFASTSFLPSSFSMYAMSLSSGLLLFEKYAMAVAVSVVGVILGWPFSILAFLPVVIYSLVKRFKQAFISGAVTSALLLGGSVLVDYYYYKRWTSSVLNLLVYNVLGGGESHLYGTEGPLFYIRNGFNNFNLCFVLAILFIALYPARALATSACLFYHFQPSLNLISPPSSPPPPSSHFSLPPQGEMAGKSNKSKAKRAAQSSDSNPTESAPQSDVPAAPAPASVPDNGTVDNAVEATVPETNEVPPPVPKADDSESQAVAASNDDQPKQGELRLYPVSVKTQSGGKMELQLNPGDSVMDIRQFLLDAPETCYFTCYELLLRNKENETHHLEDYNEISEVADITTGGCSLEMIAALYDDRSIRAHVHRARDLLSLSSLHSSLSTTLALKYDAALNKAQNPGDKPNVPELDCLGFMDDVPASLRKLISSPTEDIKCVESIVFSSFNPPPSHRRLVGDLIYLDVVTLEGNKYCITGTTKVFYVNSSGGNILDPRPSKSGFETATLIGLLQKLSSKFKKAFREVMEKKASAHPFENVQSLLPPHSWLRPYPVPDHKRDAARAEEALTISYGSELIGMQRDWNEELQSCREFPHATPQERILRDRALYKVSSDFVDAALNGAIGVISRCIPPINPTDPECLHMYVHNNIFFSFAVDADIEQLSKKRPSSNMAEKIPSSDKVPCKEGTCDGEHNAELNCCSEAPLVENEQATYASANNDLKGTKLYQEADVPGLYNLAMAIIDYRGHRVVAQSVLPGILQGDKSDALLYGSVDNGKKICWNEDFHAKVLEAAKLLHIKEHDVIDASENVFKLAAPVECKGIVGSDNRHYLLDLMRVTPRDANYTGPESRFCVLRPELITSFCQAESQSKRKTKTDEGTDIVPDPSDVSVDTSKTDDELSHGEENGASTSEKTVAEKQDTTADSAARSSESSKLCDEITFNPNVFTDFKLGGTQEEIAADEENVKKVSSYLVDVVLPKFIADLCALEVSPMDGQTLTEALHSHGVNVRYIGRIANGVKHLPHLWDLCLNEITVRSAKHILKDILRDIEDHDIGAAVSHFLNCLFGNVTGGKASTNNVNAKNQKKGQGRGKGKASAKKSLASYMMVDSNILWSDIQEFAKAKFEFELPEQARTTAKNVPVLRNLCQKVGISVAARKYDFGSTSPFDASDVLDLRAVVKHSVPVCSEAKTLVEMGKVQLAEGMLSESYTFFSEAFSILQQVTGPMHREVANCCRYLAMVLYHAGDMAGAIMQQHKELIINERCLGLDHPDTAHSYGNMALFYHGLNQTELALQNMGRALLLLGLSSGPDHPDVAATFINVAMMYQDMGKMDTALRYLQDALKKNERLLGPEHIQTAVCYHALAIACNSMGLFKLSQQHEKKTYDILVKQLGENDSRTKDSQNWMKTFEMREVQKTAQKQKGQAVDAANTKKAIDLLKSRPDLIQAFQNAAAAERANTLNEAQPRGRGFDERAARAAAEVRKKAAAKGLLVRPQSGVPVQQLSQLINPGTAASSKKSGENGEAKKVEEKKETSGNGKTTNVAAPAGLGAGLASLDKKNQKAKK